MTTNKETVLAYMDAFHRVDHAGVLACLTDDVEWYIPGAFRISGKEAFDKEIEHEDNAGGPEIETTRLTEENDVVIAEGKVRARKKDGEVLNLEFCDVFEMREGKIRRLVSYLMPV